MRLYACPLTLMLSWESSCYVALYFYSIYQCLDLSKSNRLILYVQILKDGMEHVGKLISSNLGARMDSEPKRWRIVGLWPYSIIIGFFCTLTLISQMQIRIMNI